MHVTVLAPRRSGVPQRQVGEVSHVYAEGDVASVWLADRGWQVDPVELPLRVFADELVTTEGVLRRVWHSAAVVRCAPSGGSTRRARLILALQGAVGSLQPPGLLLAPADRPISFETTTGAAWAEMLVSNANHEWIADTGGVRVDQGDGRLTAAWTTVTSMLITLLNSEEPIDESVLSLMVQAAEHAAAALLVERRLIRPGGGAQQGSASWNRLMLSSVSTRPTPTSPSKRSRV